METTSARMVDLAALAADAARASRPGAVWSLGSADLNLNLIHLGPGQQVEAHVNAEVDVILVGVAGAGVVALGDGADEREERLALGLLCVIPKGVRRAIRADGGDLAYLTCHRRRAGLMPTRAPR